MKASANTCHLLATGNYEVSANINEFEIGSSKKEKLLGISIGTRLSFEHHITSLCKKPVKSCMCLQKWTLYGLEKTEILSESICNIPI